MRSATSAFPIDGESENVGIELPVIAAWGRKSSKVAMSEFGAQSYFAIQDENSKNKSLESGWTLAAAKWGLWAAMCVLFGCYMAVLAAFPVGSLQIREKFILNMADTPFGLGGKLFLAPSSSLPCK